MDIERLVTDYHTISISADDFAGDDWPGIHQSFLHEWHFQSLSP